MQPSNKPEETVSIELDGMEEIFVDVGGQTVANMATTLADGHQMVATISKASRLLQIPYTTLRRQVKEGKFKTQTSSDGKTLIVLDGQPLSTGDQMVAAASQAATSGGQSVSATKQMDKLLEFIERQSQQLQDASCRIGWLESQLQEREKELKLLTDSQHRGLWSRMKSWLKSDR